MAASSGRSCRDCGRRKLPGCDAGQRVAQAGAEDVDAELALLAAVHTGESHLEQDLRIGGGHIDVQQVDDLAAGRGDLHGAGGGIEVLHCAAEEHHVVFRGDPQVRSGEFKCQFAADCVEIVRGNCRTGANRDIEELTSAADIPDNKAGFAGRLAIDHDFGRIDGSGFGHVSQSDRNPLNRARRVNQHGFSYGHREFICRVRDRNPAGKRICGGRLSLKPRLGAKENGQCAEARDGDPSFRSHCFASGLLNFCSVRFDPLITSIWNGGGGAGLAGVLYTVCETGLTARL